MSPLLAGAPNPLGGATGRVLRDQTQRRAGAELDGETPGQEAAQRAVTPACALVNESEQRKCSPLGASGRGRRGRLRAQGEHGHAARGDGSHGQRDHDACAARRSDRGTYRAVDLREQRRHRRPAPVRLRVQALRDRLVHAVGERRSLRPGRQHAGADRGAQLGEITTRERPLAVQRLPCGGAEAEDIGSLVGGLAAQLLGGHVRGRAHQHPGPGQRGRDSLRFRHSVLGDIDGGDGLQAREAEVGHPHATVGADQDVVRLEVPVDDPGRVRGGEAAPRGGEDLEHRIRVARFRAQPRPQRSTVDILHRDEELLAEQSDVVHRDDVGVGETCHRLRLAGQPGAQSRRVGRCERRVDKLERHHAIEIRVLRGADRPHPAGTDRAKDPVAADALRGSGRRSGPRSARRHIAPGARDERATRRARIEMCLDGPDLGIREPSTDDRHHLVFREAGAHDGATVAHNRDGRDGEPRQDERVTTSVASWAEAVAAAHARWPSDWLADDVFIEYLRARIADDDPGAALSRLAVADSISPARAPGESRRRSRRSPGRS